MNDQNLIFNIQDDILLGLLSFRKIAEKYGVSLSVVNLAWDELCEQAEKNDPVSPYI